MTAKIIDFAQKQREKRERELLQTDINQIMELSPEELKNLQVALRAQIIDTAQQRGETVYKQDGYTVVMHEGMAFTIPDLPKDEEE